MYMPIMVDIQRVTVFGGERGEGLQKTQKLALFADDMLVVPEGGCGPAIELPAGPQSEVREKLPLPAPRSVPVHPQRAGELSDDELRGLIAGRTWVVSDLESRNVNERIFRIANEEHVLCTVVDTKDLCSVWFMSLVQTEHIKVGISSGAKVSFFAPRMREYLQPLVERRELEASVLAQIRSEHPRETRAKVLERLYADPRFRSLADAGTPYKELLEYARQAAGRKEGS